MKAKNEPTAGLPEPIVVSCRQHELDELMSMEWVLNNRLGSYASSTVIGCNARRYHGLLIAATQPPVGRVATLATVMEELTLGGSTYALATNEFDGDFSPRGMLHLQEFRNDVPPTYVYRAGPALLVKQIMLAEHANAVAVRYTLHNASASLRVSPFVALRDFHHLRQHAQGGQMMFENRSGVVMVQDRSWPAQSLYLSAPGGEFAPATQWWYRFRYRMDLARGQDGHEDLYTPGSFVFELGDGQSVQINASLGEPAGVDFDEAVRSRRARLGTLASAVGSDRETTRRLAVAADAFVVRRSFPDRPASTTILAGYPWFADWGRDTFIALPGLLLATGRLDEARQVFSTFASAIGDGIVPNRFDDYSSTAHYNSIDASLWFILAAERFMQAGGDERFWRDVLMPAAHTILTHYQAGTRFDIHADADGLLKGGSHNTQLTWMDAKLGDEVVTPRHGKAVEINALWYNAHQIMGRRCRGVDDKLAEHYRSAAQLIEGAFVKVFWNDHLKCLFDCVSNGWPDGSLRPNQILAVSLPYSPLNPQQQRAVVDAVSENLLTPYGLRTLSPFDGRYRRRYGMSWESRDRAYHQGTVWAWLMGPYVEAYLKVNDSSAYAVKRAEEILSAFDGHLRRGCLGQINEIFDGDSPHEPQGCFAQAWSVAEVLRARLLVEEAQRRL